MFPEAVTSEWLDVEIDKRLYPEKYDIGERPQTFFETFDEFLERRKLSDWRLRAFVADRPRQRFGGYAHFLGQLFQCNASFLANFLPSLLECAIVRW